MIVIYKDGKKKEMIINNELAFTELIEKENKNVIIEFVNYVDIFTIMDSSIKTILMFSFLCLNLYQIK